MGDLFPIDDWGGGWGWNEPVFPMPIVEPPPVSFGGEGELPMDIPPYVYAIPELPPVDIPEVVIAPPSPLSPGMSVDQIVKTVSSAAMTAIQLVRAWEQRKLQPNTVAKTKMTNGSEVTAKSDGTIVTRTTTGKTTVSKPEVGLPQSTVDGFVVINNGDGTFQRINSMGQSETVRYALAAGGAGGDTGAQIEGGISPALLIGGAALAFFALSR